MFVHLLLVIHLLMAAIKPIAMPEHAITKLVISAETILNKDLD